MDIESARAAATLLLGHRRAGTVLDALPPSVCPSSREEGYLIQGQVLRLGGSPLWGWKVAATSLAGQAHIGVDGPMAGCVLADMVSPVGAEISLLGNRMRVAEAEFAFRIGRDLPARARPYGQEEVLDAVAALHPAIEVPDSRYTDFVTVGAPQLIADDACAGRFVLGPPAPETWRELDLASHVVVGRVGDRLRREGVGANVLGDPRLALTWLVDELRGLGVGLQAGLVVTTGTCLTPLEIGPGEQVTMDFGSLGEVGCRFERSAEQPH